MWDTDLLKSILGNALVHTYFVILAGSLNMKISIILIHHKMNSFYTRSMLQLNWTFSSVFDNRNWQCLVTFNTALPHKMLDVYINVIKTLFFVDKMLLCSMYDWGIIVAWNDVVAKTCYLNNWLFIAHFLLICFKKFPLGRHGKTNICLYCLASIVTKLIIYIYTYIYIYLYT